MKEDAFVIRGYWGVKDEEALALRPSSKVARALIGFIRV